MAVILRVIRAADDALPAAWVTRGTRSDHSLHVMVPDAFEAYARVFHPASLRAAGELGEPRREEEVRWEDVARANGRTMHGAAEWGQVTGDWSLEEQCGLWDSEPSTGPTPERLAVRVAEILRAHTSALERCWFGVWEGWGEPRMMFFFEEGTPAAERERVAAESRREAKDWHGLVHGAPAFQIPSRGMRLLTGALEEISGFYGRVYSGAHPPSGGPTIVPGASAATPTF